MQVKRRCASRFLLLAAALGLFAWHSLPSAEPRAPALALVAAASEEAADAEGEGEDEEDEEEEMPAVVKEPGFVEAGFLTKVFGAAAQGATAAMVAAMLSACTEPLVNRLLVKRMTFSEAYKEVNFKLVSTFFLTTFPTNMLKFPVFEVINMMLSFTALSGQVRGIVNGWLFCTMMLPVTNYRFRKSMGWEIKPALLYQAYIPTVARDIMYGWARGLVGSTLNAALEPDTFLFKAFVFGLTIFLACIISSPGNEWRGYTLQPPHKKLPFGEYFKPVNYMRSTGVGATIMGIALMVGMLVTPYAEMLFSFLKAHLLYTGFGVLVIACLVGTLQKK